MPAPLKVVWQCQLPSPGRWWGVGCWGCWKGVPVTAGAGTAIPLGEGGAYLPKSLNKFPFPFLDVFCHLAFNCRVKKRHVQTWLGQINVTPRCRPWNRIEKPERLSPFRNRVSACFRSGCWMWHHLSLTGTFPELGEWNEGRPWVQDPRYAGQSSPDTVYPVTAIVLAVPQGPHGVFTSILPWLPRGSRGLTLPFPPSCR